MNSMFNGTYVLFPPPGALGRGQKAKYYKISITNLISKILNQTLCVFSQMKDIKQIRRDYHSFASHAPGVGFGCWGHKQY